MNILKCTKCNAYTLKEKCPECDSKTFSPKPPKYSPLDQYGKYRLIYKKEQLL
ncbi:RNA-protein complex protein Nop10 [Candidatus Woesearchaeota archaeon]|nr:RNA-protein complex protein Nop10 [Candidatus Woesearchaeota archaeon]